MGKSTTLGIGLLAVLGAGAYIYLKNKKATTPSGIIDNTTNKTGIVTPPKKGLLPSFLGGTPPKASTPSIADTSLGLQPTTTTTSVVDTATGATKTTKTDTTSGTAVTTVTNVIDETKTNNYIMAKKISEHIESLLIKIKDLSIKLSGLSGYMANVAYQITEQNKLKSLIRSETALIKTKTAEANALGYKILPYGLIEKM